MHALADQPNEPEEDGSAAIVAPTCASSSLRRQCEGDGVGVEAQTTHRNADAPLAAQSRRAKQRQHKRPPPHS
jgi:hypothetical protein